MYFKSKNKKFSIIAGAIMSTVMISSFSGFATGLPVEQTMNDEQKVELSNEVSNSFEMEETKENLLPKTITISEPGNYRLIGSDVTPSNPEDTNEFIVNINDNIEIVGDGEYNVTMDNVKIHNGKDFYKLPIEIAGHADVHLAIDGKNILNNDQEYHPSPYYGMDLSRCLDVGMGAKLTITELSEGSCLDISGQGCGISSSGIITIKGGNIVVTGNIDGVRADDIIIENGTLTSNGGRSGIKLLTHDGGMVVKGGTVTATGNGYWHGISGYGYIIIEGGKVTANCNADGNENGNAIDIYNNLNVIDGSLTVVSGKCNISAFNIIMIDGEVNATGALLNESIYASGSMTIENTTVTADGNIYGHPLKGSMKNLKISGDKINL